MSVHPGGVFKVTRLVLPAGGTEPDGLPAADATGSGIGLALGGEGESLARLPPPSRDWVRVAGKYGGAGDGVRPSSGKTGAGADFKPMSGPHEISRPTNLQAGTVKTDSVKTDVSGSRNLSQPVVRYLKLPGTAAEALTKRWGVSDQPGDRRPGGAAVEKLSPDTAATSKQVEAAAKPLIDFINKAAQQAAERYVKFEPAAGASAAEVHSGVNPTGAKLNCQACTIAVDLKAAGIRAGVENGTNASAKPVKGSDLPIKHMEAFYGRQFKPTTLGKIFETMGAAGDGARGIVWGLRTKEGSDISTTGHVFNVLNVGGRLKFVDGQTGRNASFEGYSGFRFMRTD